VLRLAPPLIIDERHVEKALSSLDRACDKLAGSS
jgi:acetylornithine/succinyldiaminopimelate/putrescine aminotransferase